MDAATASETRHRPRRPPFGIIAVAILRLINAVGLVASAFEFEQLALAGPPLPWSDLAVFRSAELVFAGLTVIGVVGLLLYKRWGWVLTMVLVGVGLLGDLLRYWFGEPTYMSLLLHVLAAFYLNARSVKALAGASVDDEGPTRT